MSKRREEDVGDLLDVNSAFHTSLSALAFAMMCHTTLVHVCVRVIPSMYHPFQ